MKKLSVFLVCLFAVTVLLSLGRTNTAHARSGYAKAFMAKYVGDESTEVQKTLAAEIKRIKSRCYVCHDSREEFKRSKENRNPYGQTLAKYLTEKDQKDEEKATKMLEKVEREKVEDAEITFGELLKVGKLPFEYPEE